ncbi:AmmeMemoRadiSam system protein A [Arsenicicoccus bolidensis]|uniref:AmmeMemoRadiSam system protein A n=1 Tax=Arsenicicoccus bolidensis TaxID=229480 RepID=UPI0028B1A2C1|nr:AmmeMemoRadiSam system protein A [Arsenicicoccus bolidensis]
MTSTVPADAGPVLLAVARGAIHGRLGIAARQSDADFPDPLDGPTRERWLLDDGASFVTLHLDRRLRGCIGTLTAYRPLLDDVRANAVAAASTDPRFPPVGPDEAPHLAIEVSVLSVPEPIQVTSERDAVLALRPRVDGVVLEAAGRRATYLPQVWDQLTDPLDFLRSLRAKAGLSRDHWDDGVRLSRYSVTSFEEEP